MSPSFLREMADSALGWTFCQPDSKEALKDYQGCLKGLGHQLGEAPTG